MNLVEQATKYMFFTGKGGVGKTSVSCAVAIALADRGRRVLLVSTDPASNLDEVLHVDLKLTATAVPGVSGLDALNIDPEAAAREYRERLLGPYRDLLPEASLKSMEEQLSGSCTTEIAAFDEFARILGDGNYTANYDHVIFDTAPTGHTMRLLSLPKSWTTFIEGNTTGTSCLGPLAGLRQQQDIYASSVRTLMDGERTTLVLVSRPEQSALREAAKTSAELGEIGVANQRLVLNGILKGDTTSDATAAAFSARAQAALHSIPESLAKLPTQGIYLSSNALLGVEALRSLFEPELSVKTHDSSHANSSSNDELPQSLVSIVDELEKAGKGLIMTMGKGGVGKTSIAAAIAVELARRGNPVHLSTTDPAAHVAWVVDNPVPLLTIGRIDPAEETRAYQHEVMECAGGNLDEPGRALLDEDLRSPCTEEVAVFRSFANIVARGQAGFVVLDTAPTGHTILLLDAAQAYHKEVLRQSSNMPDSVINLLPRLRDPGFTRILIITLPEATPVHEAKRLQEDLARADIHPFAWILNQSLSLVETTNPVLQSRRANEKEYIKEVTQLSNRVALVPWLAQAPSGTAGLELMLCDQARAVSIP